MGQYYMPALKQDDTITIFNRDVDGEYTGAKLLEHSWLGNKFCDVIASKIYKKPSRLVWCGDYADEFKKDDVSYSDIWGENTKEIGVKSVDFSYDHKYLVNHDKKLYIDLDSYIVKSTDRYGWTINPIPLMVAQGNGRGGGDYYSGYPNFEKVGEWTWDLISIEDETPEGFKEYDIYFQEV